MVYLPWIAMMAISVVGVRVRRPPRTPCSQAHGWTQSNTFWMLSVWVFFQAASPSRRAGCGRGASCRPARPCSRAPGWPGRLLSLVAPGQRAGWPSSASACSAVSAPDSSTRPASTWSASGSRSGGARKTGFVNGGFAYGSLPFIFIFNYAFDTGNYHEVLDLDRRLRADRRGGLRAGSSRTRRRTGGPPTSTR